ncbi:conserved protein of unknown function; putative exported protein [Methylorubrum extorquens]|uniref:Small secreted protein n=1 Tax=Methylorubrum extorquens TaxID=408 RepID=A0A2N9ANH7_METEX|nr:hypothetical protein [Methylorubrum zatmanii]ARO57037.1 hypothetical protein B2G69_24665 [Methylorubrum zatmanii]KQQ17477.1 hypothetical protein ASF59_00615 [Methylobacterium sp. Leaf121]SOR28885.1 conserved protein of unknown function; putative exported protein [Methylorubrum extorquens]
MTILSRSLLAASVSALLAGTALVPGIALAQAPAQVPAQAPAQATAPEPGKALALTQGQIDGLLVAQPELARLPGAAPDKPDPKAEAQAQAEAEAIVKRNGFASLEEFQDASDTVDAVLGGIDPETKSYVGATPLLKKQLAALQADKAMPAKEKAEAVKEIEAALAAGEPEKPSPANITLVTRNYARLSAAMAEGDGKPK